MIPLLLVLVGTAALVAGWWLLRGLGPRARIGRILAATRVVEVGRAIQLAEAGEPRYVGVSGRLDAEEPWEDESGRPLVFRRSSLERREGSAWVAFEQERRSVPFHVSGALEQIAVDADAIDDGLVVVTRESEGTAADVPDRVPAGTAPATPIRLRVEFLSAVDHALVLGVPTTTPAGPVMTAGMGRPLIVTTLEPAEAMRLLAEGRQTTTRAISGLLLGGGLVVMIGLGWAVADAFLSAARATGVFATVAGLLQLTAVAALAASPSPTVAAAAGDPRSSGQGPGLVGDPLWALVIVVVIGVTALLATLAYVRTTRGREDAAGH